MNIITKYFSQEARTRREQQRENRRSELLSKLADKAVNVTYWHSSIWITIDGVPTIQVTNGSDTKANAPTIAIERVYICVAELRGNWMLAHINDRLEQHSL